VLPALKRNPLLPVLVGFLVAAFFDFRFYFVQHRYLALGSAIIIPDAIFVGLFLMRSRLAWYAALFVVLMIAVILLLTYQLGYMGFPLTWPLAVFDVIVFVLLLSWVWKRRAPYFRYMAAKEI
jgi:hypothetical protein